MASHSRIFTNMTRTSYLLLIQVKLFPPSLKKVLSVCLSLNNIGTHPKALMSSHQFLTHTQMAIINKEAEFLKREELSSQILFHAVHAYLSTGFKKSSKLRRTNICICKKHRFILGISRTSGGCGGNV